MTQEKQELLDELKELQEEYENLENNENEEEFDEMLDECNQEAVIGQITFSPSRILKKLDPIAYNCGHNDYNDDRMVEKQKEIDDKQAEIDEL